MVIIERSIEIARRPQDVFDFVSDARNDPLWCRKVKSVELKGDSVVGAAARYVVIHRPVPYLPPRQMDYRVIEWRPPEQIVWREDDEHDLITVKYRIRASKQGTRFTQRDEAELGAPSMLHPLMRMGIGIDIARQLKQLRKRLEQR